MAPSIKKCLFGCIFAVEAHLRYPDDVAAARVLRPTPLSAAISAWSHAHIRGHIRGYIRFHPRRRRCVWSVSSPLRARSALEIANDSIIDRLSCPLKPVKFKLAFTRVSSSRCSMHHCWGSSQGSRGKRIAAWIVPASPRHTRDDSPPSNF